MIEKTALGLIYLSLFKVKRYLSYKYPSPLQSTHCTPHVIDMSYNLHNEMAKWKIVAAVVNTISFVFVFLISDIYIEYERVSAQMYTNIAAQGQ